jgi:hypothetical protein
VCVLQNYAYFDNPSGMYIYVVGSIKLRTIKYSFSYIQLHTFHTLTQTNSRHVLMSFQRVYFYVNCAAYIYDAALIKLMERCCLKITASAAA